MYMTIFTIHIIIHLNLGLKFLFYLNGKCFNFKKKKKKKKQILKIFNCDRYIYVRLLVNVFLLQRWVQAEITVHTP